MVAVFGHRSLDAGTQIFKYLLDGPGRIHDLKAVVLYHLVKLRQQPFLVAHEAFVHVLAHVQVHPRLPIVETRALQYPGD